MRTLTKALILSSAFLALPALAQDNTAAPTVTPTAPAAAAPAPAPAPAPEAPKKRGGGPTLGLSPDAPQASGRLTSPAEPAPVVAAEPSAEWKFDVTGYFRAPFRMSWGPATTQDTRPAAMGIDPGTQLRSPPLIPDANYIDWRYTNSYVAPWTELNFHYGNDRVKATVQIASYNITDSGYRRLESNLGINQAYITLLFPEVGNNENLHLTLTVGGFTNRYGAAGRYDAGKYETYLFGRTHVAGQTLNFAWDATDNWTFQVEETFGAKLEPIPFYGRPLGNSCVGNAMGCDVRQSLPAWEPFPGPRAMESTFVASGHLGATFKKMLLLGGHYVEAFANDNERASAYQGTVFGADTRLTGSGRPFIRTVGVDAKLLGGWIGDGYFGYSRLTAQNALYLQDAIEVLHSFGGWQLHDNYFGAPGDTDPVTGTIDTFLFQYSFSWAQWLWHPQAFWGQGPDLVTTVFGMYNKINAFNDLADKTKLKWGVETTYLPLAQFGFGFRYDAVQPDLDESQQNFSVISPRIFIRTSFVTHEQIMLQYSRYFYGDAYRPGGLGGMYPYNSQTGAAGMGVDKNAAQIAAIIWF